MICMVSHATASLMTWAFQNRFSDRDGPARLDRRRRWQSIFDARVWGARRCADDLVVGFNVLLQNLLGGGRHILCASDVDVHQFLDSLSRASIDLAKLSGHMHSFARYL